MEGIEFEEEELITPLVARKEKREPLFTKWVLRTNIVSTEEEANQVLLGVAGLLIIIAGLMSWWGLSVPHPKAAIPESALLGM